LSAPNVFSPLAFRLGALRGRPRAAQRVQFPPLVRAVDRRGEDGGQILTARFVCVFRLVCLHDIECFARCLEVLVFWSSLAESGSGWSILFG